MNAPGSPNEKILLWPDGAPGSEGWTQVEEETLLRPSLKVVRNVTQPSLTLYPADPATATGAAVVICPGGSWHFLSIDMEGTDLARWLAARGVTAFVLRYRLLRTGANLAEEVDENTRDRARLAELIQPLLPLALADSQQAIRLVRQRAGEWGINPARVGLLGFSAGGTFAANATLYNPPESRPSFAAAIYPSIPQDVVAPPDAPPLFLLCANDDEHKATVSAWRLYKAWKAVDRPVELHIYSRGGHGFGMTRQGLPSDTWIGRFGDWLQVQGLMEGMQN